MFFLNNFNTLAQYFLKSDNFIIKLNLLHEISKKFQEPLL